MGRPRHDGETVHQLRLPTYRNLPGRSRLLSALCGDRLAVQCSCGRWYQLVAIGTVDQKG